MDRDIQKVSAMTTITHICQLKGHYLIDWWTGTEKENQYPNTLACNLHNFELTNIQVKIFKKDDHSNEATSRGNDKTG